MAGNIGKFLDIDPATGRVNQINAINASAGAGDAGKIAKLDGTGKFDSSMMPVGMGTDSIAGVVASEALAAGALVNLWSNAGTLNVRNANATTSGKECHGFVLAAVAQGGTATIYFEGQVSGLTGLTVGGRCYLSAAAAGAIVQVPPSASGNVVQFVGVAYGATQINFEAEDGIILA